jgi:CBS domain-containing protein
MAARLIARKHYREEAKLWLAVVARNPKAMNMSVKVISILKDDASMLHRVRPDVSAYDAFSIMAAEGVAAILVMENGRLKGVFSGKDYGVRIVLPGRDGKKIPVREVMTSEVITVDPRATITECMKIITAKRIRHLPIVENGELVGLVTLADLVRHELAHKQFEVDQLIRYIGA